MMQHQGQIPATLRAKPSSIKGRSRHQRQAHANNHACLALQEKSDVEAPASTPALAEARENVVALTRQAGKVQQECGLDILPDEFPRAVLKWGLMEVT